MVAMATCPQSRSRPRGGTRPRYRTRLRSCAGSMARATCAARRCSRCSTRRGAGANVRIGQSSCALSIVGPNHGGACVICLLPCRLHILCARVMLDQSPGRRGLGEVFLHILMHQCMHLCPVAPWPSHLVWPEASHNLSCLASRSIHSSSRLFDACPSNPNVDITASLRFTKSSLVFGMLSSKRMSVTPRNKRPACSCTCCHLLLCAAYVRERQHLRRSPPEVPARD
jgi:hypothetical protein